VLKIFNCRKLENNYIFSGVSTMALTLPFAAKGRAGGV
jgi:hypothetical protein